MKNDYSVISENLIFPRTPEAAYVLGLLWADGFLSVNTNRVTIESVEEDLITLYPFFNKLGIYNRSFRHRENRKPQMSISFSDKSVSNFLSSADYFAKSNKSADKILDSIPEHLKHYWFRGLFDGDGCIYNNGKIVQICVASSYEQDWTYLENLCKRFGINYKIKLSITRKGHKSSVLRILGMKNYLTFLDYIYQSYENDSMGLKRKYDKYQKLGRIKYFREKGNHNYGVRFNPKTKKYTAILARNKINKLSRNKVLGTFDTEKEARAVFDAYIKDNNIPVHPKFIEYDNIFKRVVNLKTRSR